MSARLILWHPLYFFLTRRPTSRHALRPVTLIRSRRGNRDRNFFCINACGRTTAIASNLGAWHGNARRHFILFCPYCGTSPVALTPGPAHEDDERSIIGIQFVIDFSDLSPEPRTDRSSRTPNRTERRGRGFDSQAFVVILVWRPRHASPAVSTRAENSDSEAPFQPTSKREAQVQQVQQEP